MASLEKYKWQNSDADSSFDRATSLPDGISEIYRFEPYLPRAVRRISSDKDVQRYKDLFYIAQRNQNFTWKEYLGILRGDLCQFHTQDLVTKASQRRLASSRNSENLHNTESKFKFLKTPVSKFKIGKRNLLSMTPIVEDSESMSSMEYANASKTSFVKSSRRLASPRKERTSHYVIASEPKLPLPRYKVTKNPSFVETEFIGDTDSVLSMECNNTNNTSFVELSRRLASPRKERTSHYVTASEPKFSQSRCKVTKNPSFVETEFTGDTDSVLSMEFGNTNNTSFTDMSKQLANSRKARISHYVTASESKFPLSRYKVTRNPSFVETEYTGDTDSVFSMEFGNTNNASYVELSRRLASSRKSETSHYVTASESKVFLSRYQVTRNSLFAKAEKAGDTDSVCLMTCISMNSNSPMADSSMKRSNVSYSPQKNFLKKFGSGIRQLATKTKLTVEKLSKYCSELHPNYQNNRNMKTLKGCSLSALKRLDFNKPLTPDMLRDNISPSRTISTTSVTPNGYYEYTFNPQFTGKVKSSFNKNACTKRMLPFSA